MLSIYAGCILVHVRALGAGVFLNSGSLKQGREYHTATLLLDGRVLVCGGDVNGEQIATAEIYDPVSGAWSPTGSLHDSRREHTATLLRNGTVLVTGGLRIGDGYRQSAEIYDPGTGRWTRTEDMITGRWAHTATLLPDGRVLIAGGTNGRLAATAELYDPVHHRWSEAGTLGIPRYGHTATLLRDGDVLISGGEDYNYIWGSAEIYSPRDNAWRVTGDMKAPRVNHSATLLPDGRVLLTGGYGDGVQSSTEIYDPASGQWTAAMPMADARWRHTATLLTGGRVLIAGGKPDTDSVFDLAELYDPAKDAWQSTGFMHKGRSDHTATLLANGRVLIAGGENIFVVGNQSYMDLLTKTELFVPGSPGRPPSRYAGLVTSTNEIAGPSTHTEGLFTAAVQSNLSFTAKLALDGEVFSLAGTFDDAGVAHFGPDRTDTTLTLWPLNKPSAKIEFHLDPKMPVYDDAITGTVTRQLRSTVTDRSTLTADRAFYDGQTPRASIPDEYLGKAGADGTFNLIFPAIGADYQSMPITAAGFPQGTGFGALKISRSGNVTFVGILADGTAMTVSTQAGAHYVPADDSTDFPITFPMFSQLYGRQGFFAAKLGLSDWVYEATLVPAWPWPFWSRPMTDASLYPFGWTTPISVNLVGASYKNTPGSSVLSTDYRPLSDPGASGNAALDIEQGPLPVPFLRNVNIAGTDVVTKLIAGDKSFSLSINRGNGQFGGSFDAGDGTWPVFRGLVYQKGDYYSGGHGFFLTVPPKVKDYKGQSGVVNLTTQ